MRFALMSMPRFRITRTALGCSGFGWLPALRGFDRPGRHVLEQRLGDLRPGAVPGAQEQHPPPATRAPRGVHGPAAPARAAARDAAHRLRPAAPRGRRRGRSRSSCRGRPPSCDARTRARRRGAGAGGTTPGSAARRPAASAPAPPDRCAPAPATAATAPDAPPAARTPADPPSRQWERTAAEHEVSVPAAGDSIKLD